MGKGEESSEERERARVKGSKGLNLYAGSDFFVLYFFELHIH